MTLTTDVPAAGGHASQTCFPENWDVEVSVVLPCLNEAETLAVCIRKAQRSLEECGVRGEVIVADNGSTDGSQEIATSLSARVVDVPERGYGAALHAGIESARGEYVIMADSDDSYDLATLGPFIDKLREGYDLVTGNRFRGGIEPGAMPPLHRHFGNPLLTALGRMLFSSHSRDFYCGMRGFRRDAVQRMQLRTRGMEYACEMVVKATIMKMNVTEVPTRLFRDGRSRAPHLRSWRDGWRTLRFFLLFSPRFVFLYPGVLLATVGLIGVVALLPGPVMVGTVTLEARTLLFCSVASVLGVQAIIFWTCAKVFAISEGLLPADATFRRVLNYLTLEVGLATGAVLFATGLGAAILSVLWWGSEHFGAFDSATTLRLVIASATLLILGAQVIMGSFLVSVLGLNRR